MLAANLLAFNPDQDALYPAGLTAGAAELAVAKHRRVTDPLEMRHVEYVVVDGLRARQFDCEAFQPPPFASSSIRAEAASFGSIT